jgi:putative hydrolase of the HAD superfamily
MPFSTIRAVFFDAVGTLIYPEPPAAVVYGAISRCYGSRLEPAEIGRRFCAAFERQERLDRDNAWRTSEEREIERWRCIVGEVLDDVADAEGCFRELFTHFGRPEAWRLDPDAAGVLRELAGRGCLLGMASNYDSRLRSVVAGLPALEPLRHLVISSEVGWRKPAPQFFAALCRDVGLPPEQILLVGDDWENDYEGGRAAGLRTMLVNARGEHSQRVMNRIGRLTDLVEALEH